MCVGGMGCLEVSREGNIFSGRVTCSSLPCSQALSPQRPILPLLSFPLPLSDSPPITLFLHPICSSSLEHSRAFSQHTSILSASSQRQLSRRSSFASTVLFFFPLMLKLPKRQPSHQHPEGQEETRVLCHGGHGERAKRGRRWLAE